MAKHLVARDAGAVPSALDELLDAERQIAARNADAAIECAALVDAARAAAAAMTVDAGVALAADLVARDELSTRARNEMVRGIEAEAARTLTRYEALADDEITRLAEMIATRVTGLGSTTPGGATA